MIGDSFVRLGASPDFRRTWDYSRYLISIILMIFVFAALYRYSPCQKIGWKHALPGAIFTTLGWLIISLAFPFYVNRFWDLALVYGSIGGIIVLLIWLNISSQLILIGGEINAIIARSKLAKNRLIKQKRPTKE